MADGLEAKGVDVHHWSWKDALLARHDVTHHHWPEALLRGSSPLRRFVKAVAFSACTLASKLRRRKIVQTVHNLDPHESGSIVERISLLFYYKNVDEFIYINRDKQRHKSDKNTHRTEILHPPFPRSSNLSNSGQNKDLIDLLCPGYLRPYKGIESLIDTCGHLQSERITLTVAGKAWSTDYHAKLEKRASLYPNVLIQEGFIEQNTLETLVTASTLIVLPYAKYNSGVLFLALSNLTAVLVPETTGNSLLRKELGDQWVHLYRGELSPKVIRDIATQVRAGAPEVSPDWRSRTWEICIDRHIDVYNDKCFDIAAVNV